MVALEIDPITCLDDNYCYLVRAPDTGEAFLVDPSEAEPPGRAIESAGLVLRGILATHHHGDHVGGVGALVARFGSAGPIWVAAHASDRGRIRGQTTFVDAPRDRYAHTEIVFAGHRLSAMHVPGHTRGAIAWCIPGRGEGPADVFTGDTLFAAGCGRLFEGTPEEMFRSLRSMTDLPDDARIWFGHEYTAANLRFAVTVEPVNAVIRERMRTLPRRTTPTTVAMERATNPFLRAASVRELAERRAAKDGF